MGETSYIRAFRSVLEETGFQAGQHEVLAESLAKLVHSNIQIKAAIISKATQDSIKEARSLTETLEKHQQSLDKAKRKYQKSLSESTLAKRSYLKADSNPTVSRNEIAKLRYAHESLQAQCEDFKGSYASELLKTNKYQTQYYHEDLPAVINNLNDIEIDRIDFVKYALDQCVAAEKLVAHIIEKCREDMENAIHMIDPVADSELLVDRLKTGNIPPVDLPFEETPDKKNKSIETLGRRKSEQKLNNQKKEIDLFQRKRETEEKILAMENDIKKGHTEIKALRVMIQSYTQIPTFGDAKTFQEELDSTILKVQKLEADLHSLNLNLKDLENQLEEKKSNQKQTPLPPSPSSKPSADSPVSSRASSAGYGTISTGSEDDGDDVDVVVALYDYDGQCGESSIAMIAGELFTREGEDEDGWTKVRRKNIKDNRCQGFVPSSYITLVKSNHN